jgi:hypothetical protein
MQKLFGRALTVIAVMLCLHAVPAAAASPTGTWLTQQGDARVRVSQCGKGICGTIVWLKEPIDKTTGKPQVDDKNPDPAKRNRRIIGLRIFAMQPDGANKWAGWIYNADDGRPMQPRLPCPRRHSSKFRAVPVRCAARRRGRRSAVSQRRPLLSRSSRESGIRQVLPQSK